MKVIDRFLSYLLAFLRYLVLFIDIYVCLCIYPSVIMLQNINLIQVLYLLKNLYWPGAVVRHSLQNFDQMIELPTLKNYTVTIDVVFICTHPRGKIITTFYARDEFIEYWPQIFVRQFRKTFTVNEGGTDLSRPGSAVVNLQFCCFWCFLPCSIPTDTISCSIHIQSVVAYLSELLCRYVYLTVTHRS